MRDRKERRTVDFGGTWVDTLESEKSREITDLKSRLIEAEEENRTARARLKHFLASGSGVVFSCRAEDGYPGIFVSEGVKALLGYDASEFLNPNGFWRDKVHEEDEEELVTMLDCLKDVGHLVHDIRMRHRDGSFKWLRNEMRMYPTAGRNYGEILCYWIDITDFKSLEEKLLLDAFHDPLTNLPNRALFMDRLGISCARIQRRKNYGFAVLCADLDRFKNINDSLGHLKGDRMIDLVGGRLLGCVRFGDTVAGWRATNSPSSWTMSRGSKRLKSPCGGYKTISKSRSILEAERKSSPR